METEKTLSASTQQRPTSQQEGKRDWSTLFGFILRIIILTTFVYLWWSYDDNPSNRVRLFAILFIVFESLMLFASFPRRVCNCPFCAGSVILGAAVCHHCLKDIRPLSPIIEIAKK